jgi:Protein of unknown function (DUF3891)
MLYREVKQGKIAITQPMHAWVAGQLARAWGNERFGDVVPFDEVCLGTEQHDVGHTAWEQAHAQSRDGSSLQFSRDAQATACAALVTSRAASSPTGTLCRTPGLTPRHSTLPALRCGQRSPEKTPRPSSTIWRRSAPSRRNCKTTCNPIHTIGHTPQKRSWHATVSSSGSGTRSPSPSALAERLRNPGSRFLQPGVPRRCRSLRNDDPTALYLTPWPFHRQPVTLVYEGCSLTETFSDEVMMRENLSLAPWVTLQTTLFPQ